MTLQSRRSTMLCLALAALLCAQSLGLLHAIVHEPATGREVQAVQGLAEGERPHLSDERERHAGSGTQSWIERLFASHERGAGCDAYHQVGHADLLWTTSHLPQFAPSATPAAGQVPIWHLAAQAAGYLARGPPILV